MLKRTLAHAEALVANDRSGEQRAMLESQLADVELAVNRLTQAVAVGGERAPLGAALEVQEGRRKEIDSRLALLLTPKPTSEAAAVRRSLESYLRDWQGLLRGHVHQAQQIVRRLVKGPLTLVPQADGYYTFTGVGTVQPLLAGIVRKLASLSIPSWNQIAGFDLLSFRPTQDNPHDSASLVIPAFTPNATPSRGIPDG